MAAKSSHYRFYVNTAWQYGLQLIKYALPLITIPYLTRVLEPSGYAIYAYVLALMSFAQVLVDFGFNLSGTKRVASAKSEHEVGMVVGVITQARLLLCLIVGVLFFIIGLTIPIIRENAVYALLSYVAVCGRSLAPDFLFQGKEQMAPLTTRYLVSKSTSTVLTFVVVRSIEDLLWIPVLDILASAIALAWSFLAAKRLFSLQVSFGGIRDCLSELRSSGYYCLSNMASCSFTGLTTLIIGISISDKAQISYWSLAMTAVSAVQALYSPISNSLYPHMIVGGDFGFAKRLAVVSIPFVAVGSIAFFCLADFIMFIAGGEGYSQGAYVIRLITPILPLSFYAILFGWPVLGAVGKVKELTSTTLISAVFGIICLLGIWFFGYASIVAYALARNATEAVLCTLRLIGSYRALKKLPGLHTHTG